MKPLLRILSAAVVLISISAFADTIRYNLNANFIVAPNSGGGDNVAGQIWGPGISLGAIGGTVEQWFDNTTGYPAGSQAGGINATIDWDLYGLTIGSQAYDTDELLLTPTLLDVGSFTFPTNGKNFTVTLPTLMDFSGTITTNCPPCTSQIFDLASKPGRLTLSFFYLPESRVYFPESGFFSTVPEPSTLGLIVTGMCAVVWRKYRQKRTRLPASA